MQRFFVVSLFLIFSCQSAERANRYLPKPPTKPSEKREVLHLGTIRFSQGPQNNDLPADAQAIIAARQEQELKATISAITAKPKGQRPNCGETGTFRRKPIKKPTPQRSALSSKSTTDLWKGLAQEERDAITAKSAAQEAEEKNTPVSPGKSPTKTAFKLPRPVERQQSSEDPRYASFQDLRVTQLSSDKKQEQEKFGFDQLTQEDDAS
jgi:hypothetical protein